MPQAAWIRGGLGPLPPNPCLTRGKLDAVGGKASYASPGKQRGLLVPMPASGSQSAAQIGLSHALCLQFIQQRFRVYQVLGIEAFSEPTVNRRQ